MKKLLLVLAVFAAALAIGACTDAELGPNAKITLDDGTVISCKSSVKLIQGDYPIYNVATKAICSDERGLHVSIPMEKVVKIEISAKNKK